MTDRAGRSVTRYTERDQQLSERVGKLEAHQEHTATQGGRSHSS